MNASRRGEGVGESVSDVIRIGSNAVAIYECVFPMSGRLLALPLTLSPAPHRRQLFSHPACRMAVLEVSASAKPNQVGSVCS